MDTLRKQIKNQAVTYILGALGLVAGLAWNDAIKTLIDFLFPLDKNGIIIKFIYAAIITVVVVLLGLWIGHKESE